MKFTLEQARKYRGLSQEKMAEKLGMSRRGYQRYEWGKTEMRIGTAEKFSKIVGIPLDQLIFDSEASRIV